MIIPNSSKELHEKITTPAMSSSAVIHIGKAYAGSRLSLAELIPPAHAEVTLVIEQGVQVIFTDTVLPLATVTVICHQQARVVCLFELYEHTSPATTHMAFYLQEKSAVECVVAGSITRVRMALHVDMYLQGADAHASCHGLITMADEGIGEIKTRQIHTGESTSSAVRLHTVVGAARLDYRGTIVIDQASTDVKASQSNKNILISNTGKVVAIPTLQVGNNKVHCTHGAAVGNLAIDELVYLQARGISEQIARTLLLQSFLLAALEGASDEVVGLMDYKRATLIGIL